MDESDIENKLILDRLDSLIKANPKKIFNWKTERNGIEWMFGVTYEEWMEWDMERKLSFINNLKQWAPNG